MFIREAKQKNQRFKVLVLDDVNSIIPRQLAWEDRELYRKLFTLLGMIRRKAGTLLITAPNIEMVIGALVSTSTFEGMVYHGSVKYLEGGALEMHPEIPSYDIERICHRINPSIIGKDFPTKIIVESADHGATLDWRDVPGWWWNEYQDRTNEQGQKAWDDTLDRVESFR